jgi:hypothetical protein
MSEAVEERKLLSTILRELIDICKSKKIEMFGRIFDLPEQFIDEIKAELSEIREDMEKELILYDPTNSA